MTDKPNLLQRGKAGEFVPKKWVDEWQNLTALGAWLRSDEAHEAMAAHNEKHGRFDTLSGISDADDLQYFYEKPWKWTREWEFYKTTEAGAWTLEGEKP